MADVHDNIAAFFKVKKGESIKIKLLPFSNGDCMSSESACCITNDGTSSDAPGGKEFLKSLSNATTLSIRVIEFGSPRNNLKAIFRLELRATAANDSKDISLFSLELDGVKDPKTSWPNYDYRLAPAQEEFLLHALLPALSASKKNRNRSLQSLTLQGCGRVKNFYTLLFQNLFDATKGEMYVDATSNMSLSILNWADFCCNVDWMEILNLPINTQELHIEYGPKMETETFTKLCEFLQSNHQHLQRLHLKTGTACFSDKWWLPLWKQTFEQLRNHLTDLTWLTFNNKTKVLPSTFDQIALCNLCEIWRQSSSFRRLNLMGHCFDDSMLKSLLGGPSFSLEELSIRLSQKDDNDCATLLGHLVQKNRKLGRLRVLFSFSSSNTTVSSSIQPLLESSSNHPTLHTLKLESVSPTCWHRSDKRGATLPVYTLLSAEKSALKHISIGLHLSSNQEQRQEQSFQLLPFYQSLFDGIRDNNGTLQSLRLLNAGIVTLDDVQVCRSIYEALVQNSTVQLLDFGNVRVVNSVEMISKGIKRNRCLERLLGVYFVDTHAHDYRQNQQQQLLWQDILQYNKTLVTIPTTSFTNAPMVEYYLKLNRHMGRRHWVNSNFSTSLAPYVLAKAAANDDPSILHFLLHNKPDLIKSIHGASVLAEF